MTQKSQKLSIMPDINTFQVVVLMGGIGSRLGPETLSVPKPMIDICGKPFFQYQLELFISAGFKNFLFLVGYKASQIEDYFGNGSKFGIKIEYSYDGENLQNSQKLLGTAGAIVNAYEKLNDSFVLSYGDSLLDIDYFEIIYRFLLGKQNGQSALMTIYRNEGNFDTSNVLLQDGKILEYNKKNPSSDMQYIDYGVSVFDKDVFKYLPRNEYIDLSDIQAKLVSENKMTSCITRKRFYEIGTPASLNAFKVYAKQRYFSPQKAVFVDRDGVINEIILNEDVEQLDSPLKISNFHFIDRAIDGLKILKDKGYLVFVITNQPAAAKGKVALSKLYDINGFMLDKLKEDGVEIDALQMCPHHPTGSDSARERFLIKKCDCRKPKTKMIDDLLAKYYIDKSKSFMIGDSFTDILAGKKSGLHTALIGDFKCDMCQKLSGNKPDIIEKSLYAVAEKL